MADEYKMIHALADESRVAIVTALSKVGHSLPAGLLGEVLSMKAPVLSHHLKILSEAGFVTQVKSGQMRLYGLRIEQFMTLKQFCEQFIERSFTNDSIEGLEDSPTEDSVVGSGRPREDSTGNDVGSAA